jgi:hypothetical protein
VDRDHESLLRSGEESAYVPAQREGGCSPAAVGSVRALRSRTAQRRRRRDGRAHGGHYAQPVHTATVALLALSGPRQFAVAGVTVYFQEPKGTPFSVQLSAAIVPAQLAPIVCNTPVVAL